MSTERPTRYLFTYILAVAFGLPLASAVAGVFSDAPGFALIMALTIGFGILGACIGYVIDQARSRAPSEEDG